MLVQGDPESYANKSSKSRSNLGQHIFRHDIDFFLMPELFSGSPKHINAQSTELVWILDFKQILLLLLNTIYTILYLYKVDLHYNKMYRKI